MKIVHFAASDKGGAGIAAVRYHNSLKTLGYDSTLYLKTKHGIYKDQDIIQLCLKKEKKQIILSFIKRILHILFNNRIERKIYSLFYKPKPKTKIENEIKNAYCFYNEKDAITKGCFPGVENLIGDEHIDIIFIHWMSGYLNTYDMKRLYEKTHARFIFTMMDIEPVTGGCHYPWNCKEYTRNCFNCPALPYEKQSLAVIQHTARELNLNYIHPDVMLDSKFDLEHAVNSTINFRKTFFCYYPIDEKIFYPSKKETNKKQITIFSIGNQMNDYRKGGRFVMEILFELDRKINFDITFLCIHKSDFSYYTYNHITFEEFEFCENVEDLANVYRRADYFLCTAIEDAAPMMLMEALMCGLPTVSFDISLAKALIENEKDGYVVPLYNSKLFAEKLYTLINNPPTSMRTPEEIHQKMVSIYGIAESSKQLIDCIEDKNELNIY